MKLKGTLLNSIYIRLRYIWRSLCLICIFRNLNILDSLRLLLKIIVSIPEIFFRFFLIPNVLIFLFRRAEIKQHKVFLNWSPQCRIQIWGCCVILTSLCIFLQGPYKSTGSFLFDLLESDLILTCMSTMILKFLHSHHCSGYCSTCIPHSHVKLLKFRLGYVWTHFA